MPIHVVKSGETIYSIAQLYDISLIGLCMTMSWQRSKILFRVKLF